MKFFRKSLFTALSFGCLANANDQDFSAQTFLKTHKTDAAQALKAWYTEFILDREAGTIKMETEHLQILTNVAFLGTVLSWLEIQVRADIRRLTYLQWQLRKDAQTYEEKQQTLKYLHEAVNRLKPLTLARLQAKKTWQVCVDYLDTVQDENLNHAIVTIQQQITDVIRAWLNDTQPGLKESLERAQQDSARAADTFGLINTMYSELLSGNVPVTSENKENALVVMVDTTTKIKEASEAQSATLDQSISSLHEYVQGMLTINYQMFTYYYVMLHKTLPTLNQIPLLMFNSKGLIAADERLEQLLPDSSRMLTAYVNQLVGEAQLELNNSEEEESAE